MKFLVSLLNFRPGRVGGTETYLRELIAHLCAAMGEGDELVLLEHLGNTGTIVAPGARRIVVPWSDRRIISARALEAWTPWRARAIERIIDEQIVPDVVLMPQQSIFPKRVRSPVVMVVLDLLHLRPDSQISWLEQSFRSSIYTWSLGRANRIVAISEFTRQSLIDLGGSPERINTVQLGWTPIDVSSVPQARLVSGPYLYLPAASYPHKNHITLLRTIAQLRAQGKFSYRLVLTGERTAYWHTIENEIKQLHLRDVVLHLGHVPYEKVQQLYHGTDAVLFPTRHEGFGLPVLEAVAFGRKLITSRLPVFDELGVPARFQIDFTDPAQLLTALAEPGATVLEREPNTWDQCARQTLDVLREVAIER